MKKIFGIVNAVFIAATLISAYCYYEFGGLWLKALTSSGFVAIGLINLAYTFVSKVKNKSFPVLMVLGLAFCLIGDIVINIEFIPGALIFALGHIFYFSAYCRWMRFEPKDLIPCISVFIASLLTLMLYPGFDFDALIFGICVFYALIISFMVGKTIANVIRAWCAVSIILVIGSILFFISDLALVLYMFGDAPGTADTICLATYFPGQCFLAYSLYCYSYGNAER